MRHIKIKRTPAGLVEVDITRDAEAMLERLADLHVESPDLVDDLLTQLGAAVRFRDAAAAERDSSRTAIATEQAASLRQELVAHMAAVGADGLEPVVVGLSPADALGLASELTAAAGPRPAGLMRGVA